MKEDGWGEMKQNGESDEDRPLVARWWVGIHFDPGAPRIYVGVWQKNERQMPKSLREEGKWLEVEKRQEEQSFYKKVG